MAESSVDREYIEDCQYEFAHHVHYEEDQDKCQLWKHFNRHDELHWPDNEAAELFDELEDGFVMVTMVYRLVSVILFDTLTFIICN